ncbi:hypothetical protein JTE90_026033 [Oedothorax gibbosus]|uniref:Uncharacterized protein n=1 Tax=Oedothorax gibbosus TaxID=931172 RepID=A0AAV6TFG6_9ARAC|nr:hypothetical protein JTE90_026033 [Oedothorax gibbosus]
MLVFFMSEKQRINTRQQSSNNVNEEFNRKLLKHKMKRLNYHVTYVECDVDDFVVEEIVNGTTIRKKRVNKEGSGW